MILSMTIGEFSTNWLPLMKAGFSRIVWTCWRFIYHLFPETSGYVKPKRLACVHVFKRTHRKLKSCVLKCTLKWLLWILYKLYWSLERKTSIFSFFTAERFEIFFAGSMTLSWRSQILLRNASKCTKINNSSRIEYFVCQISLQGQLGGLKKSLEKNAIEVSYMDKMQDEWCQTNSV